MKKETGRFRQKRTAFTATSNKVLFDDNLSMDTKTLHSMITYYISIPDFTLYKSHLQKQTGCGTTAFNRMWKELKENGYLEQYKFQDDKGTFYYEYELFDEPQEAEIQPYMQNVYMDGQQEISPYMQNPHMDNPCVDSPLHGKRTSINKTIKNKTLPNKNISNNKTTTTKKEVVIVSDKSKTTPIKESIIDDEMINTYKENMDKKPTKPIQRQLSSWLKKMERECIEEALMITGGNGKDFNYTVGILKKWYEFGVRDMGDVYDFDKANGRMI